MTRQQSADQALQAWQQLRSVGLTPEQRIELMTLDFFAPPIALDVEYDITLRRVSEEMGK